MTLTPRDIEILRLVSEHRIISSDHIRLLVGGSCQGVLRRLQRLFMNSYLDRPRVQRLRGNGMMIYAIGNAGAAVLAREDGQRTKTHWSEKNRTLGAPYLEHALMVSRFQASLRYALRLRADVVLDRWIPDGGIRDAVVAQSGTGSERIPIAPDAFFTLRFVNEPEGRNRLHAIVECDRGTMTTKRYLTKLNGYWAWWRSGRQEELLGIKNFRVLTVTATRERAASLREVCSQVDAPRHRGLGMFLFASDAEYVGHPECLLNAIWRTPADDGQHSILE